MKQSNNKFSSPAHIAAVFKALGNPQRLALFNQLLRMEADNTPATTDGNACCEGTRGAFTACCETTNLSRSTVSHHFKALQDAGLIRCERDGQAMVCTVNHAALAAARAYLN